jgi:prepilin-type N-terminal cleavage/methylation domain-containing protein
MDATTPNRTHRRGFTIIEVLVVVAVIALLIGIMVPVLGHSRRMTRRTVCLSNLRQTGIAIFSYAADSNGSIPYGPKAPPFSPGNFYPATGVVTSLISLGNGAPVGLSLMLSSQLANTKKVLFCPDVDQGDWSAMELGFVGIGQAQCDYYYRHGSGGSMYVPSGTAHLKLNDLGLDSQGFPIRALAIDVNFLTVSGLLLFGAPTRTCHNQETVNILFSDAHAAAQSNVNGAFTVDTRTDVEDAFAKILAVFETADQVP